MQDVPATTAFGEAENNVILPRKVGERAYLSDVLNRVKWLNPAAYVVGELVVVKRSTEEWRYAEVLSVAQDGVHLRVGPGLTKDVATRLLATHLGKIPHGRVTHGSLSFGFSASSPEATNEGRLNRLIDTVRSANSELVSLEHRSEAKDKQVCATTSAPKKQVESEEVEDVSQEKLCSKCKSAIQLPDAEEPSKLESKAEPSEPQVENCPICLEPMMKGRALFAPECGHLCHFSCIRENVCHGNLVCPLCRHQLKERPTALFSPHMDFDMRSDILNDGHLNSHEMNYSANFMNEGLNSLHFDLNSRSDWQRARDQINEQRAVAFELMVAAEERIAAVRSAHAEVHSHVRLAQQLVQRISARRQRALGERLRYNGSLSPVRFPSGPPSSFARSTLDNPSVSRASSSRSLNLSRRNLSSSLQSENPTMPSDLSLPLPTPSTDNALQSNYDSFQSNYDSFQSSVSNLQSSIHSFQSTVADFQSTVSDFPPLNSFQQNVCLQPADSSFQTPTSHASRSQTSHPSRSMTRVLASLNRRERNRINEINSSSKSDNVDDVPSDEYVEGTTNDAGDAGGVDARDGGILRASSFRSTDTMRRNYAARRSLSGGVDSASGSSEDKNEGKKEDERVEEYKETTSLGKLQERKRVGTNRISIKDWSLHHERTCEGIGEMNDEVTNTMHDHISERSKRKERLSTEDGILSKESYQSLNSNSILRRLMQNGDVDDVVNAHKLEENLTMPFLSSLSAASYSSSPSFLPSPLLSTLTSTSTSASASSSSLSKSTSSSSSTSTLSSTSFPALSSPPFNHSTYVQSSLSSPLPSSPSSSSLSSPSTSRTLSSTSSSPLSPPAFSSSNNFGNPLQTTNTLKTEEKNEDKGRRMKVNDEAFPLNDDFGFSRLLNVKDDGLKTLCDKMRLESKERRSFQSIFNTINEFHREENGNEGGRVEETIHKLEGATDAHKEAMNEISENPREKFEEKEGMVAERRNDDELITLFNKKVFIDEEIANGSSKISDKQKSSFQSSKTLEKKKMKMSVLETSKIAEDNCKIIIEKFPDMSMNDFLSYAVMDKHGRIISEKFQPDQADLKKMKLGLKEGETILEIKLDFSLFNDKITFNYDISNDDVTKTDVDNGIHQNCEDDDSIRSEVLMVTREKINSWLSGNRFNNILL